VKRPRSLSTGSGLVPPAAPSGSQDAPSWSTCKLVIQERSNSLIMCGAPVSPTGSRAGCPVALVRTPIFNTRTSAKKAFSPDGQSTLPDEQGPLCASGPPRSPVPSLPLISCVWSTRTPHCPSTASEALVAAPPHHCASPLYLPHYPLVYWPPAYSLWLPASSSHLCYSPTSGDRDLSASIPFCPLLSYVAFFLVCTLLLLP